MSDWYAPLMNLDVAGFLRSVKAQSTDDLSAHTMPYSSANIREQSSLYTAAVQHFSPDEVASWDVLHWVVFRLMLLKSNLTKMGGLEAAKLAKQRDVFKNTVITWFRENGFPTHNVVMSLKDKWFGMSSFY